MTTFLAWVARNFKLVMADPDWAGVRLILTGFAIALVCSAAIAIHECGHLLAGLALHFRCKSFRFGRVRIDRGFRISRHQDSQDAVLGWAEMVPVRWTNLRPRAAIMILAGPLANLFSAYLVLRLRTDQSLISGSFVAVSIYLGLGSLLPFDITGHVADGQRLLMLLLDRKRTERYMAMLKIMDDIDRGTPVACLDRVELERATSIRDESVETVSAHLTAYLAALYRRDDAESPRLLETALKHSSHAAPALREALTVQAAYFQATRRNRIDLAEQWLAEAPTRTHLLEVRSRVEEAISKSKECARGKHLPQS